MHQEKRTDQRCSRAAFWRPIATGSPEWPCGGQSLTILNGLLCLATLLPAGSLVAWRQRPLS